MNETSSIMLAMLERKPLYKLPLNFVRHLRPRSGCADYPFQELDSKHDWVQLPLCPATQ